MGGASGEQAAESDERGVRWWARTIETQLIRLTGVISAVLLIGGAIGVLVERATAPDLPPGRMVVEVRVRVAHEGARGGWGNKVAAVPGDRVEWLIETKNTDPETAFTGLQTRAVLPENVELIPGTVEFINGAGRFDQSDSSLFAGGFGTGRYNGGVNTFIVFTTTFTPSPDDCRRHRVFAYISSDQREREDFDSADVELGVPRCVASST